MEYMLQELIFDFKICTLNIEHVLAKNVSVPLSPQKNYPKTDRSNRHV